MIPENTTTKYITFRFFVKLSIIISGLIFLLLFSSCSPHLTIDDVSESADTTEYIYIPESTTSDGILTPEQVGGEICFLNSFAKVGVELVCHGYPDGVTYNWKIEHMQNGTEDTFSNDTGRYTPTSADLESMITVSVEGFGDLSIYCSELPVMYITSSTDYYDLNKAVYNDAYIKMQGNSGMQNGLYNGNTEIKLRGNTTSSLEKRPFKLKLESKENMLDMSDGKNRHWTLLANAIDHTNMRNKLLYDFSGAIGTEYYVHSENIILIYNNEYQGVYQLAEHVRISPERVDIYDWEDALEKAAEAVAKKLRDNGTITAEEIEETAAKVEEKLSEDWSWIDSGSFYYKNVKYTFEDLGITLPETTGGYLIEMDFFGRNDNSLSRIESAYLQPLYFSSIGDGDPKIAREFKKTSLYETAYKYMQSFEYAIHSDDFFFDSYGPHYQATGSRDGSGVKDKYGYVYKKVNYDDPEHDGWHYSDFFDMDSLVNNFIFCEFAMNWDSMKNSFFYYKDLDGKAYIGPQWDFDWAWGNKNMFNINTYYPESWHTTEDDFTVEYYYQKVQWNRMLIRDPYFIALAYEKYHEIRDTVIEDMIKDGGVIDVYYEDLKTASIANDHKWKKTYRGYHGETYSDAVESMNEFIDTRVAWLDKQFSSMHRLVLSLGYYEPSNSLEVTDVKVNADGTTAITAKVRDENIKNVMFQLNGKTRADAPVVDGYATVTVETAKTFTTDHINCIEIKAKNGRGNYIYNKSASNAGVYNQVISNYKIFEFAGE